LAVKTLISSERKEALCDIFSIPDGYFKRHKEINFFKFYGIGIAWWKRDPFVRFHQTIFD